MSLKRKKTGLVISWQKPFSILARWRKGKGDKDTVLDSKVVLTKMKLFNEMFLMADDSLSTISTVSVSEQDIPGPNKASGLKSRLDDNQSRQPQTESLSDYLSDVFLDSQLMRLYKFESEDSGVELPSGANSPSIPAGSVQSFTVHSRESSCDSSNLNSDPTTLPDELATHEPSSDIKPSETSLDNSLRTNDDNVHITSEEIITSTERAELQVGANLDKDQSSGFNPERDEEMSEQLEENLENTRSAGVYDDMAGSGFDPEPLRRSTTSDSLEEYMDECCRLSEALQSSSNPLGSGLGYLEHICQLIEKIGQLQETNLRLQRQICCLQKDGRMTKTKEDFFQHHCNCGAASLAFKDTQMRHPRSEILSPSGTVSDLSTIPEVTPQPLMSTRRDRSSDGLWRRGLNRRSYTEGEERSLSDSTEALSFPHRRLSETYTWGRVKDLVRRTKLRNQSKLGLTPSSLKMSCPQLYRPDVGREEPARTNRNSMIALGHQTTMDFHWLQ